MHRVPEKARVLSWLHRGERVGWGTDVDALDIAAVQATVRRVGRFFGPGRYFRLEVHGFEHVPEPPVLFVSNHSGGTSIPDAWGFAIAWYRHFGWQRPLHPTAHEMVLSTDVSGRYLERRGILRAHRDVVREALLRGRDVLVMPGGDRDTWRPHRDRYRVSFAGHAGYAALALDLSVPIVPVANAGAHDSLFVITDGAWFARMIGLHRLARADIWPIHISLPWGLAIGPWPHIPLPVRLRYLVGEPITPRSGEGAAALDERVRASVQALLDRLAAS
jgi:1-acyl-sn-glycerol-3-phosphate acyltransferase